MKSTSTNTKSCSSFCSQRTKCGQQFLGILPKTTTTTTTLKRNPVFPLPCIFFLRKRTCLLAPNGALFWKTCGETRFTRFPSRFTSCRGQHDGSSVSIRRGRIETPQGWSRTTRIPLWQGPSTLPRHVWTDIHYFAYNQDVNFPIVHGKTKLPEITKALQ